MTDIKSCTYWLRCELGSLGKTVQKLTDIFIDPLITYLKSNEMLQYTASARASAKKKYN